MRDYSSFGLQRGIEHVELTSTSDGVQSAILRLSGVGVASWENISGTVVLQISCTECRRAIHYNPGNAILATEVHYRIFHGRPLPTIEIR